MKRQYVMKRTLTVLTTAVMIVASIAFAAVFGTDAYAESSSGKMIAGPDGLKEGVNTENARLVYYGDRYWYVIGYDREGVAAGSGEITLLSKDSIKSTPFDRNYNAVYNSSNLKKDIEAYTNDKLSAGERSAIVSRDLSAINARAKGHLKWWFNNFRTVDEVLDNPVEGAMLWPLSAKEATEVNENIRKTGTGYWLRSLGVPEYEERYWYGLEDFDVYVVPAAMATVWADGSVDIQAEKENTTYWKGMRPAFKLNKNDIVMVSAATGGKESEEDGTLTETGAVTERNLKLTVKDDAHKDFYVNPCDVESGEAGSLTVKYSNASTGENEYISAVIKGADGSIKQYGRLAKATTASGTATIKGLPTDGSGKVSLPEGDKIYVFNEQYNGDEKTDYASDLTEIRLTGHDWVFDDLKWDSRTGDVEASYHCRIDGNHFTTAKGEYEIEDIAPTCEEKGKQMQILSISAEKSPDGKAHSKSTKLADEGEPLGHNYNHFFGFRWTGNATSGYSKAEAIFACDHDYSHKTYVEAIVTSKVQEPTCEGIGRTLYQATLSADKSLDSNEHGAAKYAKATKKLGHDWGEVTYTWAADNSSVTASRVCKRDENHVETETVATEATSITKEPTCKAEGVGDVKTKPFTNEAFSEQMKTGVTIPIDPDAHDWEEIEKQDNPNECGGYVTKYKCRICGEEKEEVIGGSNHNFSSEWTYFPEPTCTESGQRFHACTKCGAFNFEDFDVLDPTGHDWEFKDFTWTGNETDGYEMAVANYACKNDPSHTMTANAEISEEVIDPTCKEGGKTVYTASISKADSPDETEHSESKDAKATATVPHAWKYESMEWTGSETDGYTKAAAKYTCEYGCENTAEVEAGLKGEETKADCENDGKITYTATVTEDKSLTGEEHTDSKDVKTADALGHAWHLKDMLWTGDEEKGFTKAEAKFVCNNDESHERLVEAKLTEEVTEPTCTEEGYTMYMAKVDSKDSLNGAECTDVNFAKIKDATGHAWKLKDFTWTEDEKYGYRAGANYVCKHDESHVASVGANIRISEKAATCGEPGGTLYTAIVDKDKSLTDAEVKDNKLIKKADPTGKHNWGAWKVTKKATVNARGVKTRTCKTCGKKETKYIAKLKVTGTLIGQATASGKTALKIKWTRVNNVSGYDIFMSKCNYKGKKYTPKKVKTIKGNKRFKWTRKKLKKRTAYKIYVKAYVMKNGKNSYVRTSPTVHVFTSGYRGSLTNPKSVIVTKKAVSIEKGKTYEIKAKANKLKSGKDLPSGHAENLRYLSTNKKIAAVNSSGRITARGKGKCTVYVYAANGVWKTVKVTVK